VVTAYGRGGIGKTSLALTVLGEIAQEDDFSTICWFSARDIDLLPDRPVPVTPSPAQLNEFRDHLVALVHRASSLHMENPIRHLHPLIAGQNQDPAVMAKRIVVADALVHQPGQACPLSFSFPENLHFHSAAREVHPF